MGSRTCGDCALCCKLLLVEAFNKPAGEWCKHCTKTSCSIFGQPDRQTICGPYECVWLSRETLPEELRPDRCKVVLEAVDDRNFIAFVDPQYPTIWQEGEIIKVLDSMLRENFAVVVLVGGIRNILLPPGRTAEEVWEDLHKALRSKRGSWQHQYMEQI